MRIRKNQSIDDLFSYEVKNPCNEYILLRDNIKFQEIKTAINKLWQPFKDWSDDNFPQEFSTHLHQRFWEMYLFNKLVEYGFNFIKKSSREGPDFHIDFNGRNIWIEATSPNEGTGEDAVPKIDERDYFEVVPEDKIVLRYTNVIFEKNAKRKKYLKKGIVNLDDPFIIAINGGGIQMNMFDGPLPTIIKAVYPIGNEKLVFDMKTRKCISDTYEIRRSIEKNNTASVFLNSFMNEEMSGISGLLYSYVDFYEFPKISNPRFYFIDNLFSVNHMEKDWFKDGLYCYLDGNSLKFV
jgi:hypothetical protein